MRLNLKREREKLILRKSFNTPLIRARSEEFSLKIQNKFSVLSEEMENNIDTFNENIIKITKETASEVGGKIQREEQGKLSQRTKDLIKKRKEMKVNTRRDEIELAELSKTINKQKTHDKRTYYLTKN